MNNTQLKSAFGKIERASYLLRELTNRISTDQDNKAFGISFINKKETDELVMSVLVPDKLLMQYAIAAGEVIGHARSALEHTVWSMSANPTRNTGFPVFRNIDDYERFKEVKIGGVNAAAEQIIRHTQPFQSDYKSNPLYILHELWNIDKHRAVNFCTSNPQGIQLDYSYPDGTYTSRHIPVPSDAVDGTQIFRENHPGSDVQVGAEVAISDVLFSEGIVMKKSVTEVLIHLVNFSKTTIESLASTI